MTTLELTDRELYLLTCLCESGWTDEEEDEAYIEDSWNVYQKVDKLWNECPSGKRAELESCNIPLPYPGFFVNL